MIYYFCPETALLSSGIRLLYRHVEILCSHQFPAAILHQTKDFRRADLATVPVAAPDAIVEGDIVVVPEGLSGYMELLYGLPIRCFAIALNWHYIYRNLKPYHDFRSFGIECVLTNSPFIEKMVTWAMSGLPVYTFISGIDETLYYEEKKLK